jgi:CRISPR-associated protein Csx3
MNQNQAVQLQLIELETAQFGRCQTLAIDLIQPAELIQTTTLSTLNLPAIDWQRELILFGRAPIWLYAYLADRCHSAKWLASYDVQLKSAIVIKSSVSTLQVGDRIPIVLNQIPGAALLIGGPPDSGKSILANLLRRAVSQQFNCRTYLHRANWDGEGNWTHETPDRQQVKQLIAGYDIKLHRHPKADRLLPKYFQNHARSTANIRELMDLTIVDVGGVPQLEKLPVIAQCTHYLVISCSFDRVEEWHSFCQPKLQPIAIIHTQLEAECCILQTHPVLEIAIGIQQMLQFQLPTALLQAVSKILPVSSKPNRSSFY